MHPDCFVPFINSSLNSYSEILLFCVTVRSKTVSFLFIFIGPNAHARDRKKRALTFFLAVQFFLIEVQETKTRELSPKKLLPSQFTQLSQRVHRRLTYFRS